MILVRTLFQAHHGKITQLVDFMKQASQTAPNRPRILTDLSGPMNTMVLETRHASLAAYEQWRGELFQSMSSQGNAHALDEWVASGANEFYTIEQE